MGLITLTPLQPTYGQVVRSFGPVGYWRFNETSGSTAANQAIGQSAYTLTYENSPTLGQMGAVVGGKSALLNGSNQFMYNSTSNSALNITGTAITMSSWVYPTTSGGNQTLFTYATANSVATRQYSLYLSTTTSTLYVDLYNGSTNFAGTLTISSPWIVNAWNHIVVTYNGANIICYLNAKVVNTTAATASIVTQGGSVYAVAGASLISNNPTTFTFPLSGYQAELAIFASALTAGQVQKLYNSRG